MKRILLDTSAYSRLLLGDSHVLDVIDVAEEIRMSVVVLGELFAGFRGGSRLEQNISTLHEFLDDPVVTVAKVSEETAEVFGEVKHQLKVAGTPLPLNDVWIAAQCIEVGAILITYDAHFKRLPGLRVWEKIGNG